MGGGRPALRLLIVCIRKGPRACIYLGSGGSTKLEVPRKLEGKYSSTKDSPFAVPNMCNIFTDGQAAIDLHNNYRQNHLAIERAIPTKSFITRLDTHFAGIGFVDSFFAAKHHIDTYVGKSMPEILYELAFKLIYNPYLRAEAAAARPMPGLGAAGGPSGVHTRNHRAAPTMDDASGSAPPLGLSCSHGWVGVHQRWTAHT